MASDLLTTIRSELEARLAELRPLLSEYEQLVAAADALDAQATGARPPSEVAVETAPSSAEGELAASGVEVAPSGDDAQPPAAVAVDAPAKPLRARRGRGRRGSAAGAIELAASGSSSEIAVGKPARAARGAAEQAILAALEHGSHTAGELVTVTAMSSQSIRTSLSRLVVLAKIVKTKRDGKTAYALSGAAGEA
jgi:hypothetical protein